MAIYMAATCSLTTAHGRSDDDERGSLNETMESRGIHGASEVARTPIVSTVFLGCVFKMLDSNQLRGLFKDLQRSLVTTTLTFTYIVSRYKEFN
jgi:hypothetical protein